MADQPLLTSREEARGLLLAERQPRSSAALHELFEKVRSRVVAVVLADRRVAERLSNARRRVVGADLREEKTTTRGASPRRLAEVGIYDYDSNILVVASVDLRSGQVEAIVERPGSQPPPSDEEVAEAAELALGDNQFQSLRRQRGLQIVAQPARAATIDDHRLRGHRVFMLTFWSAGDAPRRIGEAAVDLSTRNVVSIDEADPFGPRDAGSSSRSTTTKRR